MVRKFTWTFQNVYENTSIDIEDGATCADLFIYNNPKSNTVLIAGSISLPAGQTLSLPAFGVERQEGTLLIDFGFTGKGWITIGRKRYK